MSSTTANTTARLPDFLCVGVEKCGTTSLYDLLAQHPAIGLSRHKETHFFNTNWDKGLDWYRDKFSHLNEQQQRIGEITPAYHRFPEVIPRIKQTLGSEVKILIMLREPRQRAFSHYIHDFANQLEVSDLVYKRYLATCRYTPIIQQYLEAFGREQCLVQIFEEDFLPDPQRLVDNICRFLGIPTHTVTRVHSNPSCLPVACWSPDYPSTIRVEEQTLAVPKRSVVVFTGRKHNTRIVSNLDEAQGNVLIAKVASAVRFIPAMKSSIVYEQNVREDLEQVEQLIHRKLDVWRQPLPDLHAPVALLPEFLRV